MVDPFSLKLLITHDQARELRERVRQDLRDHTFGVDDINMNAYNGLIQSAANLFPGDQILNGGMRTMPDSVLRSFGQLIPISQMPVDLPSKRLEAHLSMLIDRMELLVGKLPTNASAERAASEVLQEEQNNEIRDILNALEALSQQQPELPALDQRDFEFIANERLRHLLIKDFVEAQRAFAANAYKASSLLCGGIIEGMLLDRLQQPEIASQPKYVQAVSKFPKVGSGDINWDRVSLTQLIDAAGDLGLLANSALKLAPGARDFRDTVHPNAELRERLRAGKEEAELLLAFVKLVYRDLVE